ncbi:MAG: hypothetical protein COC09_05520 [Gammaproteobacteria bacterium]|nr:MAG: hypothetical protein COC09_05520 [Gammaproteobacteria bacterium]
MRDKCAVFGHQNQYGPSVVFHTLAGQFGKSENYVMISYKHCNDMMFAGTDEPPAYLELKSIG